MQDVNSTLLTILAVSVTHGECLVSYHEVDASAVYFCVN